MPIVTFTVYLPPHEPVWIRDEDVRSAVRTVAPVMALSSWVDGDTLSIVTQPYKDEEQVVQPVDAWQVRNALLVVVPGASEITVKRSNYNRNRQNTLYRRPGYEQPRQRRAPGGRVPGVRAAV